MGKVHQGDNWLEGKYIDVKATVMCSLQNLRRDIVSHRGDLDRLCKLYCSLAHTGRDDIASELRMKVDEACQRWKTLSQRISSVMKSDMSAPTVDKELESLTVRFSRYLLVL